VEKKGNEGDYCLQQYQCFRKQFCLQNGSRLLCSGSSPHTTLILLLFLLLPQSEVAEVPVDVQRP
jgi:hypothetical protein